MVVKQIAEICSFQNNRVNKKRFSRQIAPVTERAFSGVGEGSPVCTRSFHSLRIDPIGVTW